MEFASKIITLVSDLLSRCGGPLRGTFGGGSSFSVVRYMLMEQKSKLVDIYTTGGAAGSVEAIHTLFLVSFPGLSRFRSSVCIQYNTRRRKSTRKTGKAWSHSSRE